VIAAILSALAIYPWNLSAGGYYATGQYSTGADYTSRSAYLALDRRRRDLLTVGVEESRITTSNVSYRQQSLQARTSLHVHDVFSPGLIAGWLSSNDVDGGQMLGVRLDGELPWVGYTLLHHYGEWALNNYETGKTERTRIRQSELDLWRSWNSFWVTARYRQTHPDGRTLSFMSLALGFKPIARLSCEVEYGRGSGLFLTDWNSLTVDNSRDKIRNEARVMLHGSPIEGITLSLGYVRKSYLSELPNQPSVSYSLSLWVGGLTIRI
jgi:hypothetical protein